MNDRSKRPGIRLAERWGRGSEVWLKQEELRKFRAAHRADKPTIELAHMWDELRSALKNARHDSLMDPAWRVRAVRKGINELPFEIPVSILWTMVIFDPQEGTMSNRDGSRQFECVEFVAVRNSAEFSADASAKNGGGRLEKWPWRSIEDAYFTLAAGKLGLPENFTTLCNQVRDAAQVAMGPAVDAKGGPSDGAIRYHFETNFPQYFKQVCKES